MAEWLDAIPENVIHGHQGASKGAGEVCLVCVASEITATYGWTAAWWDGTSMENHSKLAARKNHQKPKQIIEK